MAFGGDVRKEVRNVGEVGFLGTNEAFEGNGSGRIVLRN